jgi:chemotaxis protein methyltransferase CheR
MKDHSSRKPLIKVKPRVEAHIANMIEPLIPPLRFLWRRLPKKVVYTRPMTMAGTFIYDHYVRDTERNQSQYTCFMRNVPQLEVLSGLLSKSPPGAKVRLASIGCSTGAELYSALWVCRTARPDLHFVAQGADICKPAVEIARRALYPPTALAAEDRFYDALDGIFEVNSDGALRVKDWLREGVSWLIADAADPYLLDRLGVQEVVFACNFLGPMKDAEAEACLRNITQLVAPTGYLVLDGIDLDLKTQVLRSLKLVPVTDRIEEIHLADATKRDWPWTRWGHEPFNSHRPDWAFRYSTIFAAQSCQCSSDLLSDPHEASALAAVLPDWANQHGVTPLFIKVDLTPQ